MKLFLLFSIIFVVLLSGCSNNTNTLSQKRLELATITCKSVSNSQECNTTYPSLGGKGGEKDIRIQCIWKDNECQYGGIPDKVNCNGNWDCFDTRLKNCEKTTNEYFSDTDMAIVYNEIETVSVVKGSVAEIIGIEDGKCYTNFTKLRWGGSVDVKGVDEYGVAKGTCLSEMGSSKFSNCYGN